MTGISLALVDINVFVYGGPKAVFVGRQELNEIHRPWYANLTNTTIAHTKADGHYDTGADWCLVRGTNTW